MTSVDADLPMFSALDDAVRWVGERGGGVVRVDPEAYELLMADTLYGQSTRKAAAELDVRFVPLDEY